MLEVELTIDGQKIKVDANTTILQAAKSLGIVIPTLCYHAKLSPFGACRICLVEIEQGNRLVPACITKVLNDMVVHTQSEKALKARRTNLELLLARHPSDCLTCEKGGECELQQVCFLVGVSRRFGKDGQFEGHNRLVDIFGVKPLEYDIYDTRAIIERDLNKCVLCKRCIRVCHEIQGVGAINFAKRGFHLEMGTFYGRELDCEFCGQCVDICPVGALVNKLSKYRARVWQLERTRTICSYCSCGCSLILNTKNDEIIKVHAYTGLGVNDGNLCYKGRYGFTFVNEAPRLRQPLIREGRGGKLREASWEEALDLVAARLREIKEKYGPESIAGVASARCTNEDNYLFQKLMRLALGTNNIDNCSRFEHAPTIYALLDALGYPAMSNSIEDVIEARSLLVIGTNPPETHPILGIRLRRVVREKGAKLVLVDPRRTRLLRYTWRHLALRPGTDVALVNGIMQAILEAGLEDKRFIRAHTQGVAEFKRKLKKYTPEKVAEITGVPAELMREVAETFAQEKPLAIFFGMGLTQHANGREAVYSLINLALLTGSLGVRGGGLNCLRGQNNSQGVCDMGALPDFLPGYLRVEDAAARRRLADVWGKEPPGWPGVSLAELPEAILEGRIKALYVLGENPVLASPDMQQMRECLEKLEFLVTQDIFLSETGELADVVLPGTTFAEKEGTFTNTERRVQLLRQAIRPVGDSRPDWEIIADLGLRLGVEMSYNRPSQILDEICKAVPLYGGIDFRRLQEGKGIQWPCPEADHPGTSILYAEGDFPVGRARFTPVEFTPQPGLTSKEFPYLMLTGKWLFHYHTGVLTKDMESLVGVPEEGVVEINPLDAERLGIGSGDRVRVRSSVGEVELVAKVSEGIACGMCFVPVHFRKAAANLLLGRRLDPESHIPELKMCAVSIQKI